MTLSLYTLLTEPAAHMTGVFAAFLIPYVSNLLASVLPAGRWQSFYRVLTPCAAMLGVVYMIAAVVVTGVAAVFAS